MAELALADIHLHYATQGAGPPLLLIPGMFSDAASWAPLVPLLQDRFTLILPDPRGAGRTRPSDADLSLTHLVADMVALLDHLGHERAFVLGHSLGGLAALALAGAHPDRISGVIALATTSLPSARIPALFATLCALREAAPDRDLWLRALFPLLFHDTAFRDPAALEAAIAAGLAYPHLQSAAAMRHQADALARLDLDALPARLDVPARALLAEEDALIPAAPAARAFGEMGVGTEIIRQTGHSLHWDRPQAVADRIAAAFAR